MIIAKDGFIQLLAFGGGGRGKSIMFHLLTAF